MRSKILILIILWFIVGGIFVWLERKNVKNLENMKEIKENWKSICIDPLELSWISNGKLKLVWKVISTSQVGIIATKWWIVKYLKCDEGSHIKKWEVLAKIYPDYNDPNIKNLINQKQSLITQKTNLEKIINSTKQNFDIQLKNLEQQKDSIEKQLKILKQNLENLKQQKKYSISDLKLQLSGLQDQLVKLEQNKENLIKSKQSDLQKIQENITNLRKQIQVLIWDTLEKVDELRGISDKNKHKNDAFEDYLSAKNTSLKEKVKNEWRKLNYKFSNIKKMSDEEVNVFATQVINFLDLVKRSVKDSVSSPFFPQSMIDWYYNQFLALQNNLIALNNNYATLLKTKKTTESNYNVQINSVEAQIINIKTNIDNIKRNKLDNLVLSLDTQINQLNSQIITLETNLKNIKNQINSIKQQRDIQLNNLNSQLTQIKTSIKNIQINLSPQILYSPIDWVIQKKNVSVNDKVGPTTLLCVLLQKNKWKKLQISSYKPLNIWDDVFFEVNGKKFVTKIKYKLPYKDPVTDNYLYETDTISWLDLPLWTQINVEIIPNNKEKQKIAIPVDYLISHIDGYYLKVKTATWVVLKKVEIWKTDLENVEILSGITQKDIICK